MIGSLKEADPTGILIRFTWEDVEVIRDALEHSGTSQLSQANKDRAYGLSRLIYMFRGTARRASL